jgi:hypothetical protein
VCDEESIAWPPASEMGAVCANERPYGSVGVPGNWYPYRDRLKRIDGLFLPSYTREETRYESQD